jgi:hypothetical protein
MELLDGQLAVMLLAVHELRPTVAAIQDCPFRGQFIGSRALNLNQLYRNGSAFFRKPLVIASA